MSSGDVRRTLLSGLRSIYRLLDTVSSLRRRTRLRERRHGTRSRRGVWRGSSRAGELVPSLSFNEVMAANGAASRTRRASSTIGSSCTTRRGTGRCRRAVPDRRRRGSPPNGRFPTGNRTADDHSGRGFLWSFGPTAIRRMPAAHKLQAGLRRRQRCICSIRMAAPSLTASSSAAKPRTSPMAATGMRPVHWQFLSLRRPGRQPPAYPGVVSDPAFSHEHGFYDRHHRSRTLSCTTPEAMIYYTTDGSEPFQGRRPVHRPEACTPSRIRIAETTCVRARRGAEAWVSSRIDADLPLPRRRPSGNRPGPPVPDGLEGVAADYAMSSNIVSNPQYGPTAGIGPAVAPFDVPGHEPAGPVRRPDGHLRQSRELRRHLGTAGLGRVDPIRTARRGSRSIAASGCRAAAFRSPGHAQAFVSPAVQGGLRSSKLGIRCSDRTPRRSSRPSPCGRGQRRLCLERQRAACHVSCGTSSCATSSGPRATPAPTAGSCTSTSTACTGGSTTRASGRTRPSPASYYGGEKEDWDAFKHKSFALVQGDRTALNQMLAQCQEAGKSYEALLKTPGQEPRRHGESRLSVPAGPVQLRGLHDRELLGGKLGLALEQLLAGATANAGQHRLQVLLLGRRGCHAHVPLAAEHRQDHQSGRRQVGQPHSMLGSNPEYRLFFADRIHRLFFNDGVLTPGPLIERYARMAAVVENAIILEAARWGDQHGRNITPANWISMRDRILNTYLPHRTAVVLGQFRTAGLVPERRCAGLLRQRGLPAWRARRGIPQSLYEKRRRHHLVHPRRRRPTLAGPGRPSGRAILVPENAPKRVLVPTKAVDNAWRAGYASMTPPGPP